MPPALSHISIHASMAYHGLLFTAMCLSAVHEHRYMPHPPSKPHLNWHMCQAQGTI